MSDIHSKKKVEGVLLMRGNALDICIPSVSPLVYTFQFPPETYAEMEIKNGELAVKSFTEFYSANKLPAADFHLILQAPLFRKDFPIAPQEKFENTIETYLDYIPFDTVLSKRIKTDNGVMILAANGDLIQTIRTMASSVSSHIIHVASLEALTLFPKGGLSILTQLSAETILRNGSLIQQESFPQVPQRSINRLEIVEEETEKKEKSSLPLLISIFVVLLLILAYVYTTTQPTPRPVAPKKISVTPTP